jgi:hypothetical protein
VATISWYVAFVSSMRRFLYCQHRNVALHDKAVQRNLQNHIKLFYQIPTTKHAFNRYKTTHPHPTTARSISSVKPPHPQKRYINAGLLFIYIHSNTRLT